MRECAEGIQQDFLGAAGLEELGGTVVVPLTEVGAFTLRAKSIAIGSVSVGYVAATPCRLSGRRLGDSVDQAVHLVFPLDTSLAVEDCEEQGVPAGGLLAFGEANVPRIRLETAGRVLVVSITEGARSLAVLFSEDSPCLVISSSPSVSIVRAVAELVFRSPERDTGMSELLGGVCGMLLLDAYIAAEAEPKDDKLVVAGLRIIGEEFRNKDFKARDVAKALGISLRVLQRAFADRGGASFVIRTYRTQEALRILESDAANGVSFDVIARKSGFADGRAMRKAIAATTGMLPKDYRKNFG